MSNYQQSFVRVDGLKELEKALKDLGSEVAGQKGGLVKNALRAVARDVKDRMVAGAPESQSGTNIDWHKSRNGKWVHGGPNGLKAPKGRLKRSIFIKRENNPRRLSEIQYVGPRAGKDRNDPKGAWYAAIAEMHGGQAGEGMGYMRRSIKPDADVNKFGKNLGAGIERVAKKIGNENAAAVGNAAKKAFR